LNEIKRRIGTKKVGHTGTLDKFATGLLLVLAGNCTKLTSLFLTLDKEYSARVILGYETDTLDPEGKIIDTAPLPSRVQIESVLPAFIGEIDQVPPIYSAIHINGQRAYKIARKGESCELVPRRVRIDEISICSYEPPYLEINVRCSSGTYIRSLARDIAHAAQSCGYLDRLRRTRIGSFHISQSVEADRFDPDQHIISSFEFIANIVGVKKYIVDNIYRERILNGALIEMGVFEEADSHSGVRALFDSDKKLLAIINKNQSGYEYLAVMQR
jgi:tRNA pseudouridine55 synthase